MSQASDDHLLDLSSTMTRFKPELLIALPDVPTLAILSLLPLRQLIVNLPLVHPRLAPIRENTLKGTQRLVLLIGDKKRSKHVKIASRISRRLVDSTSKPLSTDPNWCELDQLHLATLDFPAVGRLTSLMPAIVHLQVVISHAPISVLHKLAILLSNWAPTLQTLQLSIGQLFFGPKRAKRSVVSFNMHILLQAINRKLEALQHLTLDIGKLTDDAQFADEFLFGGQTGAPLSLPILGQLREFYLHLGKCENGQSFLLDALKEHDTEKLTNIGLNGVPFEKSLKPELLLSLPDVPTLSILSLLPLRQLIVNLPLVHPRLAPIRESALEGTQRLVLLIGDQKESKHVKIASRIARRLVDSTGVPLCTDPNWCELDQLHLATLDFRMVRRLSSLMPAIVHLQVVVSHAPTSVLRQLAILLTHWAPSLKTLQLHLNKLFSRKIRCERLCLKRAKFPILNFHLRLLLHAINPKFVSLQHLTLDIGNLTHDAQFANEFLFGGQTGAGPLRLPILGQLREFYLDLGNCANGQRFLFEALKEHDTEKLTNIGLNGVPFAKSPKPDLLIALPDVPTLAILSLLPLQQLIVNLPLVHRRLAPFCQSVLKGTQRLVLHIGDQRKIKELLFHSPLRLPFASHLVDSTGALLYPETDFYTLHLATLDEHSLKRLSTLMPAIVHLQVVVSHAPISVLPELTILLANWAPSLQELKLTIGNIGSVLKTFADNQVPLREEKIAPFSANLSNLHFLIRVINSKLRVLQTLSLDFGSGLFKYPSEFLIEGETGVPLSLPILGQLREFYFSLGIFHIAKFLLDQLEKYATEKLTTIGLGGRFDDKYLTQVAKGRFAERFTLYPFSHFSEHRPLLRSFPKLKVYTFDWKKGNFLEKIDHLRALSRLSHLQCLKLDSFSPVSHPLPASPTDLPSLRSVMVLKINISGTHSHLQAPYWATLFPSVQIVKVNHGGEFCAICYPGERWMARLITTNYAPFSPCLRQLFAPLRVLPALRKIFYQRDTQSDRMDEFTPQGDFVRTQEFIG